MDLESTAHRQETDALTTANFDSTQWLQALVNISRKIANLAEFPTVLQSIVSVTTELIDADVAVIALLNHEQSRLFFKCFIAESNHFECSHACDAINSSIAKRVIADGRALCFPQDQQSNETAWPCPLVLNGRIESAAIVPLKLDNTCIGVLVAARRTTRYFNAQDLSGLEHLADQTVIALEHASMTSRIQSIAIVEERYRIAREMHDGLAQVLGYLNVQMQTLEMLVNNGDTQQVLDELSTARQSIRTAQDDVRESILSLRTTLSDELTLPVALKEYAIEFGVQTGLDVHFKSDTPESPPVTPLANVEIVRIVQEALTNIRKHAQANTVTIDLKTYTNVFEITITDDGVGFDLTVAKHGHFGLATMKERARQVGGITAITSQLRAGTTIKLKVPLTLQL